MNKDNKRKSIVMGKSEKVDKYITYLKEFLKMNDFQLSELLQISENDLIYASQMTDDLFPEMPKKDEELYNLIISVYCYVHRFNKHFMTSDDVIKTLTHEFEFGEENNVQFKSTLIQLAKGEVSDRFVTGSQTVDRVCKMYFRMYTIGELGDSQTLLNKKIAEEFYGRIVEVQEVNDWSEYYGDSTHLEVQERVEVFNDGSGESWKKLRNFSGDMTTAWLLVDELGKKGVQIRLSNKALNNEYWWCYLSSAPENNHPDVTIQASTAPEAICLAVLEYLSKKKESNKIV